MNIESLEFPADGLAQAEISVTSLALNDPDHARLKVEFRRDGERLADQARRPQAAVGAPIYQNRRQIPTFREMRHSLRFNSDRIAPKQVLRVE